MKKLQIDTEIESEVFEKEGKPAKLITYDIIIEVLKAPSPQGVNFETMAEIVPLIRKMKSAKEKEEKSILLEKSEHSTLIRLLKNYNFKVVDPALMSYIEGLDELVDIEVEAKK